MAGVDSWSDFENIRANVRYNTVDKLKQIITGLNEECHAHLSKSGKKQEIIDRIITTLDNWRATNAQDKWLKAKSVIAQLRDNGYYSGSRFSSSNPVIPQSSMSQNSFSSNRITPYNSLSTSSSSLPRYDPYAPPRRPSASTAVPSTSSAPRSTNIQFKPSPFFSVDHIVTNVTECPESSSATDRKQAKLSFCLTSEQSAKLKLPGYQLRLFCTSSVFYTSHPAAFRTPTNTNLCPIEFPPTCEVRVNGVLLTANLKGLKKKPGTAPPPDISKLVRGNNLQNTIDMVYVNNQQPQPAQPKKFYLVTMMVEATTVEQLVDKLKKGKYRSCDEIKQQMASTAAEDDDIVAGPQKLSLKCPLSFMRVNTACRSIHCVHAQCFDATSWFSVMEQTTTWLCPVCEKVLNPDDLIIDGYFDDILKKCPDSVEDVMVETDGEWHTMDDKYASPGWKSSHPTKPISPPVSPPRAIVPIKTEPQLGDAQISLSKPDEIVVLDSDDEEEGQVKRELSPSFASTSSLSATHSVAPSVPASQVDDVIDLTLDSDDDEPPPAPTIGQKRKAMDTPTSPTEEIWKKGRVEPRVFLPGSSNNYHAIQLPNPTQTHNNLSSTTLPPLDYQSNYRATVYQSPYPPRGAGGGSHQPYNYDGNQSVRVSNGGQKNRWQ